MKPEDLRVVQVIPVLAVGGLERVAVTLTLGLAERVSRVAVCSRGGDAFAEPLRAAGVPIHPIPRPRPRNVLRAAVVLAQVLRRERPHLLHTHNPAATLAAALARSLARLRRTAIVATFHGLAPERARAAAAVFGATADVVVAIGPATTRELLDAGMSADRVVTVYNGVASRPTRDREEVRRQFGVDGSELVVTIGRYTAEKNQRLLVDALARLAPRRPRLRGLVVGEGPLEGELREHVKMVGLDGRVEITGPRLDALDVAAAADVFGLTSSWEGLGIALLEAMSVRRPVVATAVGGVPDFVRDGETGLLVPPGDPEAFAAAIERLLDAPELALRLTEQAARLVERKFSQEIMLERYVQVYLSALERRSREHA